MRNVLSEAGACQVWPMRVGNACETAGWLILAYSGLFRLIRGYCPRIWFGSYDKL